MLHDIGKVFEYETGVIIGFTTAGNLLGHIPIGAKLVQDKIDGLEGFPEILKNKIIHMILSHHGSRGLGSPVEPLFPEAVTLHGIDSCDASTKHAIQRKMRNLETTDEEFVWDERKLIYLK